jgi:CHAT domain-containing protein/tetratricopeptide (TPR) repeat protein
VNLAREHHLSFQEIEWLAEGPQRGYGAPGQAQGNEIRLHLGECEPCQGMVQMHEDLQRRLGQRDAATVARSAPDCPVETVWWEVVAGQAPQSRAAELLEHSTRCDACGLLLHQAIQDFAEEVAEQEIRCLTTLPSTQREWQQALAQRLVASRTDGGWRGNLVTVVGQWARSLADRFDWRPRRAFRHTWAYATVAIVVLAAGTWFVLTQRQPSIDQLIASAYVEQRPFELRIAGAAYGPVRQERGGERSAFAEPADLLRAKYLIKERLAARPNDQAILMASGKVELLEGHYDEAIRTFSRMLDAQPDSPALLTDLATAYFQRAVATDRALDYGQTIELLGRTLAKKPDDPVALFNRAIALQKMYAYDEAIRDWEHYLSVDSKGNWADEARRRLGELKEEMKARDRPAALLKSDPVAAVSVLRARKDSQSTSLTPWSVSLDEEYLDLAVRQWLPSLYVSADSSTHKAWRRERGVWDALDAAADVFRTVHKDPWLADLLHELPADSEPLNAMEPSVKALGLLAQAARANASGDPDSARPLAESAARLFHIAKSDAGYLRAREEIVYSLVRAGRVQDCIQATGQQLHATKLDLYPWLQGQATLWNATCQGFAGNLDLAQLLSERALEFTKSTGYTGQHLRCVLFAAGFLHSTERNWQDTRAGLREFWADWHNPFHAYESYAELSILAEDAQEWHLVYLLNREALDMIERTPDRLFGARAHYRLAVALERVQNLTEAEAEFRIASQQFFALPNSPTNRLYRAASEIDLAAVEVQEGRFDSASVRLEQARPLLADISDSWIAFSFYQTLGQLHFSLGNLPEAEQALWSALRVGEVHLRSLQTDAERLAWERDAAPAYRTLVELYARRPAAATRALEILEWYRASVLRDYIPRPSPRNVSRGKLDTEHRPPFLLRVEDAVPALKNETIVSFAYLPSGVAAWAFDDRGVKFARIAVSGAELASRVRDFAYLCADPSSDVTRLRKEGGDLYTWLLAPFEERLEPSRLLIVEPDFILSNVPWSALVDPRGEYLGSRFAIAVSPGLGYWLRLRSAATISREQTALVVGMPTLASAVASRFSPLPDADREAQAIASRFRHSRLLSGKEVTSLAIRQELPHSHIFHFAGHAVSKAIEGGLVLASVATDQEGNGAEPALLSASDLQKVLLQNLQLVVLSACATAETEKGFTGPNTLVLGFLRAGVPNVVASRWPVDSHITEQMMNEFYTRLFQGQLSTRALQQATHALLMQPATSHPYYWAGFAAYGR